MTAIDPNQTGAPPPGPLAPGASVSLEICSDPKHLCLVRAMVRSFAGLAGFGGRQIDRIALAVDEACANVIRHAYSGRCDGDLTITCSLAQAAGAARRLLVRLEDKGCAPAGGVLAVAERPDPLVPGGLGLRLMHEIMDDVHHARTADGRNVLELCLDCPPPEAILEP